MSRSSARRSSLPFGVWNGVCTEYMLQYLYLVPSILLRASVLCIRSSSLVPYCGIMNSADMLHISSFDNTPDQKLAGWVLESPGRGTLSLIVTCLFTIFLCTWAVIHPRVTRKPSRRIAHKLALFLKAIVAPEFIAVEGLQEWSQARMMVKRCEESTAGELDMVRAFYIGMLALRYRTKRGAKIIWPNQYQWLLEQHIIDWKAHQSWGLSRENIRDKSNANTTVKAFAILQVSWFVAQSIMRAVHDLPLSQLESMTLSYVPLFIATYFFWWSKPKDVLTPSVVDLPEMTKEQKEIFEHMAVDTIFDDECLKEQESWWNIWKLTARVFEKEAKDKAEEMAQKGDPGVTDDIEAQPDKSAKSNLSEERTETTKAIASQQSPLKKAATEIPPPKKTATMLSPSQRRTFPEPQSTKSQEATVQTTDISPLQSTLVEKVIRRTTTGFRTTRTTGLSGSSSKKKDRILPLYRSETVVAYWDPHVYHSKVWPFTMLFGASFGALHLINWNSVFPTMTETWLWRIAALTSIVSMLVFMQYEKVVLRFGSPLMLLSIISPVVYLMSRLVMIGGVIAAFRGMDPRIYNTYVVSTYWVHVM
jgi:hypothetical protein